jgi:hypothetical protein
MGALAELPPRVGVGLPADYELFDLADPRFQWARRFGVQAAGLSRRGAGTPDDPISAVQLTVSLVPDWTSTVDSAVSTVESVGSTVDVDAPPAGVPAAGGASRDRPSSVRAPAPELAAIGPAQGGDWLRPPAYLLVNGLPAAHLVLLRRLRPPGAPAEIVSWTTEVLVPLPGSGYLAVITGATTDPARQDEAEWTTLAVAGTLTYRPASTPTPAPPPEEAPIPELRFASTAQLLAPYAEPATDELLAGPAPPAAAPGPAPASAPDRAGAVPDRAGAVPDRALSGAPPSRGSLGGGSLGLATLGAGSVGVAPAEPPRAAGPPPAPRGATIGQAAVDHLNRLVAGHPSAPHEPQSPDSGGA